MDASVVIFLHYKSNAIIHIQEAPVLLRIMACAASLIVAVSPVMAGNLTVSGDYVEVRTNHIMAGGCTYSSEAV